MVVCLPKTNIQAYSFVAVYYINFIILLCVTLKLFSVSFVSLLHQILAGEFKSEAPSAEEILDRVVCSSEQFSFQMCLESGDCTAELFVTEDTEFQTAGAVILNALD